MINYWPPMFIYYLITLIFLYLSFISFHPFKLSSC
jgi:hypothetical protein